MLERAEKPVHNVDSSIPRDNICRADPPPLRDNKGRVGNETMGRQMDRERFCESRNLHMQGVIRKTRHIQVDRVDRYKGASGRGWTDSDTSCDGAGS